MSIFGWFTAGKVTADTASKVVDTGCSLIEKAADGIDALFFTDEEKVQASQKVLETVIEMHKATADENSVRSRARRALAIIVIADYMALLNLAAILYCFGVTRDAARGVFDIANMGAGFMVSAVTIFYFGYYGIKNVVSVVKK